MLRDARAAFYRCVRSETRAIAALSNRSQSPLAIAALSHERDYFPKVDAQTVKDGGLSSNSLLATGIPVVRACG